MGDCLDREKPRVRVRDWLQKSIDDEAHFLEFELILLTFATGALDAATFPRFHTFVSNQTGNTVLIAVSALSLVGARSETNFLLPIPHIVTSLFLFIAGCFTAGQFANYFDCKRKRWWLLLSSIVQTAMTLFASLILHLNRQAPNGSSAVLGSIALLAFSSGMQVALSRQLSMPAIPTAQATAAYVDLFIDTRFFAAWAKNKPRSRRLLFILALFAGSFAGAGAYLNSSALTILISGAIKSIVTIMFIFNTAEELGVE